MCRNMWCCVKVLHLNEPDSSTENLKLVINKDTDLRKGRLHKFGSSELETTPTEPEE